jgi:hypothetical protein
MTTVALTPEGEAFLARVRDELADLPPDERDELLEDIESHLAEVAGEGEVALAARLGSAEEFAQELRNSAGLPPRAAPSEPSRLQAARAWLDDAVRRVMAVRPHLTGALVWQLARGWLLAVAFALTIAALGNTAAWSYRHTWLPHAGLRGFGALIALAGFVALSFWLARRAAPRRDGASSSIARPVHSRWWPSCRPSGTWTILRARSPASAARIKRCRRRLRGCISTAPPSPTSSRSTVTASRSTTCCSTCATAGR